MQRISPEKLGPGSHPVKAEGAEVDGEHSAFGGLAMAGSCRTCEGALDSEPGPYTAGKANVVSEGANRVPVIWGFVAASLLRLIRT